MKNSLLILLLITGFYAKSQSLTLTPDLSPPLILQKYTHSNTTNSTILSSNFNGGSPTFQTTTNTPIHFSVNDGAALMTLSSNGYVGMSNTLPTERLDIKNGRIRFTGEKSAGNPSGFVFSDNSVPNPIFNLNMVDDNTLGIKSFDSTPNFLMNVNTGYVGINTTPTSEALTVNGTVHNTQFENANNVSSPVIASVNGDLLKGEMNKVLIAPISFSRFSTKTNANYTVFANLGYYTNSTNPVAFLSAPIHVPHNVKLKSIVAKLVDNSANSYLKLSVTGFLLTGGTTGVANVNSKLSPTSSSVISINDSILHTTDCNTYFYILDLQVLKTSDDSPTFWDGSNLKIGTITLTYGY